MCSDKIPTCHGFIKMGNNSKTHDNERSLGEFVDFFANTINWIFYYLMGCVCHYFLIKATAD